MNLELVGQWAAIAVAGVTIVVALTRLARSRFGLNELEKLNAIIEALGTDSPEREMLEEIRDNLAAEWGLRVLMRKSYEETVITLVALAGITLILVFVQKGAPLEEQSTYNIPIMVLGGLLSVLLVVELFGVSKWEDRERKERGLPETGWFLRK